MTTCKRYFRNCNDFGICVNIGKKGYVLAEDPIERTTIFQYGICLLYTSDAADE